MKKDPRQQRWYCITEDTYLHDDFFGVINKTGCKHIELMFIGNTSHFIIDILAIISKNPNISPVLSDLEDEILTEGFIGDDCSRELFKRYQDLYEPRYFYFFDTDRLNDAFYTSEKSEAKCHKNKLMQLSRYIEDNGVDHFFLVPSFPSLASLAWLLSSYMRTNRISTVNNESQVCGGCSAIEKTQILYRERCVICNIRRIEQDWLNSEGSSKTIRGYGVNEKQFFCLSKRNYPFLDYLSKTEEWTGFYEEFYRAFTKDDINLFSLKSLRISEELICKFADIKTWYSAIPVVIELSRRE